jgi:ribosome-binding factor A
MVKRYRMEQVNELLRQEIGKIISEKVSDPRVRMVTVTEVETSRDLHHARVYVSVLNEEENLEKSLTGLNNASGFIRKNLAGQVRIRYIPELTFCYDRGPARGDRIARTLQRLRETGEMGDPNEADRETEK